MRLLAAALAGLVTGSLAGLLGVGGGEYRDALYLWLLKRIRLAIFANLATGFLVVIVSFALRGPGVLLQHKLMVILAGFAPATLVGAYAGAAAVRITKEYALRIALGTLLLITGVWLLTHPHGAILHPSQGIGLLLSIAFGLGIGFISAFLGVAGGEYRIPVLILFFGLSPLTAATASSFLSILSTGLGAYRHFRFRHYDHTVWKALAVVGLGSIIGAVVGTLGFLPRITGFGYTVVLAAVLLVVGAIIVVDASRRLRGERLAWKSVHPRGAP